MEGGQNQSTLPVVGFTFAGKQAGAQDSFRLFQSAALTEIRILRYKHVPDVIRMICKEHLPVRDPERDEVSVVQGQLLQKSERISAKTQDCQVK